MTILRYTTNYSFRIIDYATRSWHEDEWINWDTIDGILGGIGDTLPFVVAGGTGDVSTLTYSPAISSYTVGLQLTYKTVDANTGAATINVNGLGAKTLKINGNDLPAGYLNTGSFVKVIYDGTNFSILTPAQTEPARFISNGTSGATTDAGADEFYVENSDGAGISILTPADKIGSLNFAGPAGTQRGSIKYNHTDNALQFYQGGSKVAQYADGYLHPTSYAFMTSRLSASTIANIIETASPYRFKFAVADADPAAAFDGTLYKYTIPTAGWYECEVFIRGIVNWDTRTMQFYKNGVAVGSLYTVADAAAIVTDFKQFLLLAENDVIDFRGDSTYSGIPGTPTGMKLQLTIKRVT